MRYLKIHTSRFLQNLLFRHSGLPYSAVAMLRRADDPESRKSLNLLDPPVKPGDDNITTFITFYKGLTSIFAVLVILFSLVYFTGCDSGKETIDAVTGNQAVKQYHKSEQDVRRITDQQSERLNAIPGEEDNEDEGEEIEEQ
jgi:hypothetical protein